MSGSSDHRLRRQHRFRLKTHWTLSLPLSCACREIGSNRRRSSGWNAYLRRTQGETVRITHPCHPLCGQEVPALHFQLKQEHPVVAIEHADLTVQYIPLSWTDHAAPDPHQLGQSDGARLSGLALLDVVDLLKQWKNQGCHDDETDP